MQAMWRGGKDLIDMLVWRETSSEDEDEQDCEKTGVEGSGETKIDEKAGLVEEAETDGLAPKPKKRRVRFLRGWRIRRRSVRSIRG